MYIEQQQRFGKRHIKVFCSKINPFGHALSALLSPWSICGYFHSGTFPDRNSCPEEKFRVMKLDRCSRMVNNAYFHAIMSSKPGQGSLQYYRELIKKTTFSKGLTSQQRIPTPPSMFLSWNKKFIGRLEAAQCELSVPPFVKCRYC